MRAFHSVLAALAATAAAVNGQVYTSGLSGLYGASYGVPAISYGARYSTVAAAPALSYRSGYSSIAAAPAVSYSNSIVSSAAPAISYAAAPAVSYAAAAPSISYAAAPAISYAAAPALSYSRVAAPAISYAAAPALSYAAAAPAISTVGLTAAAAPVNVGVIAAGGAPTVRSHEIHTGSGNQAIRIEDHQAGDQVIRVHEGPQEGPQVAQVQVPGEQHHVRVINHQSGPAHIERVVARAPTQVVDVQKPGRPGARIVQVVKGQSPPPSIEFINAGGDSHHVYYADDVGAGGAALGGGVIGGGGLVGAGVVRTSYAAPAYGGAVISAAPAISTIGSRTISVAAAPAYSTVAAAPAISYGTVAAAPAISYGTVSAAPAISYGTVAAAPAISYGTVSASPAISYGLGGFHYGGLGYSTGYSPVYGGASNVFLDAKKKSSAKKSA